MTEKTKLDPDDATPASVALQVAKQNAGLYPKGDCMPCGATIRMGFFFDAFGRNRDIDDKASSQYSNICRLWEAHRSMDSPSRPINQFWYRFYYSGLGTPLNEDSDSDALHNATAAAQKMAIAKAASTAKSTAKSVGESFFRVKTPLEKADLKSRAEKALKESAKEFSFRPLEKAYQDIKKEIKNAKADGLRITNILNSSTERFVTRSKATGKLLLRSAKDETIGALKKNPLKAVGTVARSLFAGIVMEHVPIVRDNSFIAECFGTGLDTRLLAAMDQFKAAYDAVKAQMPHVRMIEVSVFGADRGCVLARAFVNGLAEQYKRKDDMDLAIDDTPIQIKFLGMFDAVSSIMSEEASQIVGLIPFINTIKTSFKERPLGVPPSVERCVHFAAAHEKRLYQRLDSIEKTRGDQFLYPGTSCDVVGGATQGSLGLNAELMRIPLRDMLLEALKAGTAMDSMEDMFIYNPTGFKKFTIAQPIVSDGKQYRIRHLVDAYQALVPRKAGLDFLDHEKIFLRWIAMRYQDPEFRKTISDPVEKWRSEYAAADYQRKLTKSKLDAEMQRQGVIMSMISTRPPEDQATLLKLKAERDAAEKHFEDLVGTAPRNYTNVWTRLQEDADRLTKKAARQDELKHMAQALRDSPFVEDGGFGNEIGARIIESSLMPADELALVGAWKEGADGKQPLPGDVMDLFDMLVHDTLLTSWQDHVLAQTLYFRTRDTDTFGSTDKKAEDEQRKKDDQKAADTARLAKQKQDWAKTMQGMPPMLP